MSYLNLVVDLDDTCSDANWRTHIISEKGWDEFYRLCINDSPVPGSRDGVWALLKNLGTPAHLVYCSGRSSLRGEIDRLSWEWLRREGYPAPGDQLDIFRPCKVSLRLRPDGNFQKAPDMKAMLLHDLDPAHTLVIDDDQRIRDHLSSMGYSTVAAPDIWTNLGLIAGS